MFNFNEVGVGSKDGTEVGEEVGTVGGEVGNQFRAVGIIDRRVRVR